MSSTESSVSAAAGLNALRPRIIHTAYFVSDIERSLRFYCGVLGMQEQQRIELADGVKEVVLRFPDSKGAGVILMWNTNRATPYSRGDGYSRCVLMVSDLDGAVKHLRAHSVPITKELTDTGALRYCMTADPDGYVIELLQLNK